MDINSINIGQIINIAINKLHCDNIQFGEWQCVLVHNDGTIVVHFSKVYPCDSEYDVVESPSYITVIVNVLNNTVHIPLTF